jgi:hypothetical protein
MKTVYHRFARAGAGAGNIAWMDSWVWDSGALQVRVLRKIGTDWGHFVAPPGELLGARAFEPSSPELQHLGTENISFDIHDLSVLSPLIEPRELLGAMLPGGQSTQHAIYALENQCQRIYIPAFLLIDRLWLWSAQALKALLTPNSLEIYLGQPTQGKIGSEVIASSELMSHSPSQDAVQRIAWLSQSDDARRSWRSVLANAVQSRMDLTLPRARLKGWLWGVRLPQGLLACELASVELHVELPVADIRLRLGGTRKPGPPKGIARSTSAKTFPSRDLIMPYVEYTGDARR